MDQIYPDNGLVYLLQQIVAGSGSGLYWRLFENNVTPSLADTLGTYTLSSTSWGRIQVAPANFTLTQVAAHQGSAQATNIVFTNTTGVPKTVYGFVIEDPAEAKLLAAARFDAAPITIADGGTLVVTPIVGDQSALTS